MDITVAELVGQVQVYVARYPFIWAVEQQYGLPRGLLLAVGSRETNLGLGYASGEMLGDGGYAYGTWQLDLHPQNWSPERQAMADQIRAGNCAYAADIAAGMLRGLLADCGGSVDGAADMYNSGRPFDYDTTGGDYGEDVAGRLAVIQEYFPAAPTWQPIRVSTNTVDRLTSGRTLVPGQRLLAGSFEASVDRCGLYIAQHTTLGRQIRWRSGDVPLDGNISVCNQLDGNLVVYRNRQAVWESRTAGKGRSRLALHDDGSLQLWHGVHRTWYVR